MASMNDVAETVLDMERQIIELKDYLKDINDICKDQENNSRWCRDAIESLSDEILNKYLDK